MSKTDLLGILVCFDPGGTTGVSCLRVEMPNLIRLVIAEELETYRGIGRYVDWGAAHRNKHFVICEHLSAQHPSFRQIGIEVMGAIRYLCSYNHRDLTLQPPGMMLAPRKIHPLTEIKSPHIRDATHHGIAFAYSRFLPQVQGQFEIQIEGDYLCSSDGTKST